MMMIKLNIIIYVVRKQKRENGKTWKRDTENDKFERVGHEIWEKRANTKHIGTYL